jgi:DNA-binding transcriptional LysR family regulator
MHNPRDLPPLDLLKSFESAARHLSFTRAGEELFLSQSAVSRQIGQLEAQLGVQLFHRRVRSLLLTEAGQLYYREIGVILEKLREVTAAISQRQSDGAVTVTTTMTFASLWLVPRLSDFQRQHPGIAVHLAADNAIHDLKKDRLDVSVRYCTRETAGEGALRLFGERVVPVCSPEFLSRHPVSKPADLEHLALLHFEDPHGHGPWLAWSVWFEVMRMPPAAGKGSLSFSHYDQLMQAALDGQGVALGRVPLVDGWLRAGKLVTPLKDKRYAISAQNRAYWLLISPLAAKRGNVQTFAAWLRECVEREALAADG